MPYTCVNKQFSLHNLQFVVNKQLSLHNLAFAVNK